jgi:hypothetical protein
VKRTLLFALAAVVATAIALPASAFAGTLTLHPAGFGTMSYAAWKAQQGEPDSQGSANQALYFQKMTTTPTFAAGVAVVKGIAGTPADELTGLAWDHREDGHCGAGAPRWNVTFRDSGGVSHTLFFGCNAAMHTEKGLINGHGWCRDTQPSPAAAIAAFTGEPASASTITGLSILFDEGTDTPNPPPAGCNQEQLAGGFVYLDNIEVDANGVVYCWTSASDNGNGDSTSTCDPSSSSTTTTTLLSPLTGLAVDPTDTELVTALDSAYPGVALPAWLLYPYAY